MKVRFRTRRRVAVVQGGSSPAQGPPGVPAEHARAMREGLALFKEHVRPALIQHCLDCHGGKATKGDLDLSDRQPLIDSKAIEGGAKRIAARRPDRSCG